MEIGPLAVENVVNLTEFWIDRRVLVTGSSGFKGSWLCLWLEALGADVVGMAKAPDTDPNLFSLLSPWNSFETHTGDMRNSPWVRGVVADAKPEVVFHLAAQSLVRRSFKMPALTFETNVMGTVNLLDAVRSVGSVRAVLVVTSDKVYRNDGNGEAFREADPLGGSDPYSASKACEELVSHAYASSYWSQGVPRLGTARGGNVIGGGDWSEDRLVPDVFRAFAAGKPLTVRNPNARRPWQHVLDLLAGYLTYAETLATGACDVPPALNFGPEIGDTQPVSWLVEQLSNAWGEGPPWTVDEKPGVPEARTLALSSTLARSTLNWRPRLPLSQTLEWAVAWHRAYENGCDMNDFSQDQIAQYQSLLV